MGEAAAMGALIAVAVGSTIYQGVAASDARDEAAAAAKKRQDAMDQEIIDAKQNAQNQKDEMAKETAANAAAAENLSNRDSARARQKTLAAGAQGRSDTILTSPLGVQAYDPSATKTLLGS